MLENKILGEIDAEEIIIGKGVVIEKGVIITGKVGKANKVIIGDFTFIGENTKIIAPEFVIGDYSKLHANSFCHGKKPLRIGRNCWIGGNVVLDSMGGLDIDDNVGIGAHSQLWTHIKFGDVVQGSRFNSEKYMHISRDVWFVGHCIVSPIQTEEKAMAMVGSVITRDMKYNNIYAGVPAKNITDKVGYQFEDIDLDEKVIRLQGMIDEFEMKFPEFAGEVKVIKDESQRDDRFDWFNVKTRTYYKRYREAEIAFLQEYTPLIKFTPFDRKSFIFD